MVKVAIATQISSAKNKSPALGDARAALIKSRSQTNSHGRHGIGVPLVGKHRVEHVNGYYDSESA